MSNTQVVDRLKIGSITLTILTGQYGNSFTINKSYKDKQTQEWKNTDFLNEADLPVVQTLLDQYWMRCAKVLQSQQQPKQADPYGNAQNIQQQFTNDAPF